MEGADPNQEFALFVLGPCSSHYDPQTDTIEVEIVVDSYTIKKPSFTLTGHMTDRFTGSVSEDGKTWTVESRIFASLDGAKSISDEFAEANPDIMVFHKSDRKW